MKKMDKDSDAYEKLSLFIGRYILTFQYVESKIDQMLLLATDLNRWHVGQTLLARMGYRQKVDALSAIVHSSKIARGTEHQRAWTESFDRLVKRLQDEGTRRNDIVHSLHMFEFVKIGAPVLRSRRSSNSKGFTVRNVEVDETEFDKIMAQIAMLFIDANFAHVQLVHWYDDLGHQGERAQKKQSRGDEPTRGAEG